MTIKVTFPSQSKLVLSSGPRGISGFSGFSGGSGPTGSTGSAGPAGASGFSGISGFSGTPGSVEYSGISGFSGVSGASGFSGYSGQTGGKYDTTSNSTFALGNSGTFTVYTNDLNLDYTISQSVVLAYDVNNHQHASVVAYNKVTGQLDLLRLDYEGTGTYTLWEINLSGIPGIEGTSGFSGKSGFSGLNGTIGVSGFSGKSGFSGLNGTIGVDGVSGFSGYSGVGTSGFSGSNATVTVANNTGLAVSLGDLSTTYNTLISDDVSSVAVGGAAVATANVWKTKNIVQVLDTILFPDVLPTYTIPTLALAGTQTGIKEIGSSISQALTLTAVENDAGIFTQLVIRRDATTLQTSNSPGGTPTTAIAPQFGYADPNNPNLQYVNTYTDVFTVISGVSTWTATSAYAAGLAKQNNKGVTDVRTPLVRQGTAPQAASPSLVPTSITVTGIYPYFWGKSSTQPTAASIATAIAAGTQTKVLADSTGTITITYNAAAEYIWVAHVATSTSKTKWFNTALNNGSIGAGQFILAPVTQAVNSPESFWTAVSFKVYISSGATNTTGSLEFRNT